MADCSEKEKSSNQHDSHGDWKNKTGMAKLYDTGYMSDVTIKCRDGSIIQAHKNILAAHSDFSTGALNPKSNFKEANTATIEMPDDNPVAIRAMMSFFYFQEYNERQVNLCHPEDKMGSLELNVVVFLTAEKYMVWELRDHAYRELLNFDYRDLTDLEFLDLLSAMSRAYAGTGEGHALRQCIVKLAVKNRHHLHAETSKEQNGVELNLLLDNPQFLLDILWSDKKRDLRLREERIEEEWRMVEMEGRCRCQWPADLKGEAREA